MKIEPFPKAYQRKRTTRKRLTGFCSPVSSCSSGINGYSKGFAGTANHVQDYGGYNKEKYHLPVTVNPNYEKKKCALLAQERKLLNTSSQISCFPHGPRSKVSNMLTVMISHIAAHAHAHARRRGRKRKARPKDKWSDLEVTVPQHIRFRGRKRRGEHNSSTITNERGKLDSATFLRYFMHMWSAFPEEKVKFFAYFDPLWLDLYAKENNRMLVLNWIKEKGIFSKKYVLVPIVMWSHWSLLIFCHLGESLHSNANTPCMLLLDSLHAIGPTRLEPLIRRLLYDIHQSEERLESKGQLRKMPLLIPKVPQQKKGDECGFYVLYYIKLFIESAPESFMISEGYPYFMNKDWFSAEAVELFCKRLDTLAVLSSDDDDSASVDSNGGVELIEAFG